MAEKMKQKELIKSVRYEYLGNVQMRAVATVREREVSKLYREKLNHVYGTKKQFYKNSVRGLNIVEPTRSLPKQRNKNNVWKPVITTGESDAKIRMPPPKLPPPRFIKKKKDSPSSVHLAKLRPTLRPVESNQCYNKNKNRLKFVPFELPKAGSSLTLPVNQNSFVPRRPAKPQPRIVKQNQRIAAADSKRRQIMTRLRPMCKPGENKAVIPGNEMRKLVNSWAKKLGSFCQYEQDKRKKDGNKIKNSLISNKIPLTKAQLKQAACANKAPVRTSGFPLINRYRMGKFKSWKATYHTKLLKQRADSDDSADDDDPFSCPPIATRIPSNQFVTHTIELLQYKRELESCMENLDEDDSLDSVPVIPSNAHKGHFLLESIPLTAAESKSILMKRVAVLLAHGGFTHAKMPAIELLAHALSNFMLNFTQRLKQIRERELAGADHGFPDPMERVLMEMGMGGVRGLQEYYKTKVLGYHRRMLEQCNYLKMQRDAQLKRIKEQQNIAASTSTSDMEVNNSETYKLSGGETPVAAPAKDAIPELAPVSTETSVKAAVEPVSEENAFETCTLEKLLATPVQDNLDGSGASSKLKETLSQCNILRLNFENTASDFVSHHNDITVMKSL